MGYPYDAVVYQLTGEDVEYILEDMELNHIANDKAKLATVVEYLINNFEMYEWYQQLRESIEIFLEQEEEF